MKGLNYILGGVAVVALTGCANLNQLTETQSAGVDVEGVESAGCPGDTDLPNGLVGKLQPVEAPELLRSALGEPEKGKLCQGQVYQAKADTQITLYRAWNSTNPYSQMGKWWAAHSPEGKVAQYRADYEICYQWSPLDKLTRCTLAAGAKVVIGTGQSAKCSEYLTYPASEAKQVYIENASEVLSACSSYDASFSWKAEQ